MSIQKDAVVRLFDDKASRPLTLPEVEALLALSEEEKAELPGVLDGLVQSGDLVALRGQRYGVPQRANLLTGILKAHPNGFGYLLPDKPGERAANVFIGRNDLADAMHGDKVVVRVEKTMRQGKPEGRIVRILERRVSKVVGEYQSHGNFGWVIPEAGRHLHHVYIPDGKSKKSLSGQIVVADITKYPSGNKDPEGEIVRVLGNRTDPDVDMEVIIERYGLSSRFPTDVLTEAKAIPETINIEELGPRVDLRGLKTITIDGEHAKDFDDAVAIARTADGRFRLWISIADVAHYVREGSALDREARARATSVYFPDRVVPMLPEELSNGICSLNPHVERLAMTVEIELDSEGKVLNRRFFDSVIVSKERMTYTDVAKMLVDRDEDLLARYRYLEEDLRDMEELALKLKSRREERGSLDFDLPQPDVILDMEGNIEEIVRAERNIAHRMVEEFMLAANEAVADFLTHEEVPVLYRCHDEPESAKLEDLRFFLHNLNLKLDRKVTPKALQRLLRQVRGRPLEKLVNEVVLRTMKHAYYSPRNAGHFGLASERYLHFTSPIRRYPDLIVHRILKQITERGGMSEVQREGLSRSLGDTAAHCSEREKNSESAEREALALKKVQFMEKYVGEEFDGYISGVTPFGFFVELRELFVDGLIHISTLGDDYYDYRERSHQLIGQRTGRTFQLADRVRVHVVRVDPEKRHIDFALVGDATREEPIPAEQPKQSGRPVPHVDLGPVHPESGDGRGRLRRQNQPQPHSNRMPQRAPRPEEVEDDDRGRRRPRRERSERNERKPARQAEPEAAEETPENQVEAAEQLQGKPEQEGDGRRKRRRRGGRGRRRRSGDEAGQEAGTDEQSSESAGEQAAARGEVPASGEAVESAASEGAGQSAEAKDTEEKKPASRARRPRGRKEPAKDRTSDTAKEGESEPLAKAAEDAGAGEPDAEVKTAGGEEGEKPAKRAPSRGRTRRPTKKELAEAKSATGEQAELGAEEFAGESTAVPDETPTPRSAEPAAEKPQRHARQEDTASDTNGEASSDDEAAGGEEGENELAFVAKRRRRRRGGRGRRKPRNGETDRSAGDESEAAGHGGEPVGEGAGNGVPAGEDNG